jgi:hypothetical protein
MQDLRASESRFYVVERNDDERIASVSSLLAMAGEITKGLGLQF